MTILTIIASVFAVLFATIVLLLLIQTYFQNKEIHKLNKLKSELYLKETYQRLENK
jgi:hypothetical protein